LRKPEHNKTGDSCVSSSRCPVPFFFKTEGRPLSYTFPFGEGGRAQRGRMRLPHPPLRGPPSNQGVIATGNHLILIRCAGNSPKGRVLDCKTRSFFLTPGTVTRPREWSVGQDAEQATVLWLSPKCVLKSNDRLPEVTTAPIFFRRSN